MLPLKPKSYVKLKLTILSVVITCASCGWLDRKISKSDDTNRSHSIDETTPRPEAAPPLQDNPTSPSSPTVGDGRNSSHEERKSDIQNRPYVSACMAYPCFNRVVVDPQSRIDENIESFSRVGNQAIGAGEPYVSSEITFGVLPGNVLVTRSGAGGVRWFRNMKETAFFINPDSDVYNRALGNFITLDSGLVVSATGKGDIYWLDQGNVVAKKTIPGLINILGLPNNTLLAFNSTSFFWMKGDSVTQTFAWPDGKIDSRVVVLSDSTLVFVTEAISGNQNEIHWVKDGKIIHTYVDPSKNLRLRGVSFGDRVVAYRNEQSVLWLKNGEKVGSYVSSTGESFNDIEVVSDSSVTIVGIVWNSRRPCTPSDCYQYDTVITHLKDDGNGFRRQDRIVLGGAKKMPKFAVSFPSGTLIYPHGENLNLAKDGKTITSFSSVGSDVGISSYAVLSGGTIVFSLGGHLWWFEPNRFKIIDAPVVTGNLRASRSGTCDHVTPAASNTHKEMSLKFQVTDYFATEVGSRHSDPFQIIEIRSDVCDWYRGRFSQLTSGTIKPDGSFEIRCANGELSPSEDMVEKKFYDYFKVSGRYVHGKIEINRIDQRSCDSDENTPEGLKIFSYQKN